MKTKATVSFIFLILLVILHGSLQAQNKQVVVVTIEGISSTDKLLHFNKGEELREQMKFGEAVSEYSLVVSGSDVSGKEAEALYDIGICYTWMGKKDNAEATFQEVLAKHSDNPEVVAFTNYGLSWVDVQRGDYNSAIERLQSTLDEMTWDDPEFCARAQFQIGRIYYAFLTDRDRAGQAFQKVLDNYPNSKITNHPFFDELKVN